MRFQTRSGSEYEVDSINKRIRQIKGSASKRMNRNGAGEWVPYKDMEVRCGAPAWVLWPDDVPLLEVADGEDPENRAPMTLTSEVVGVDHT